MPILVRQVRPVYRTRIPATVCASVDRVTSGIQRMASARMWTSARCREESPSVDWMLCARICQEAMSAAAHRVTMETLFWFAACFYFRSEHIRPDPLVWLLISGLFVVQFFSPSCRVCQVLCTFCISKWQQLILMSKPALIRHENGFKRRHWHA